MKYLSAQESIDAGRWAMRHGSNAVSVDPVARQLGVAKVSFYWHFSDRSAWLAAILERWESLATDAVIAAVAKLPTARERLRRLFEVASSTRRGGSRSK